MQINLNIEINTGVKPVIIEININCGLIRK